jgi:branched-chain amino acid transport system substrate-binding protein
VKQAPEFYVSRSGQTVAALYTLDKLYTLDNQITGASLENTARMSASTAFYWDMDDDTRAFTARIMKKSNGVAPTDEKMDRRCIQCFSCR